jgi:hypothetical protein
MLIAVIPPDARVVESFSVESPKLIYQYLQGLHGRCTVLG